MCVYFFYYMKLVLVNPHKTSSISNSIGQPPDRRHKDKTKKLSHIDYQHSCDSHQKWGEGKECLSKFLNPDNPK